MMPDTERASPRRRALRTGLAVTSTLAVTAGFRWAPGSNITTVGFAYLLVVLAVASGFGFTEALVASLAAAAEYNFFFLPPLNTFTIADARNWVALAAFLVTATVASQLSTSARRQARRAEQRRRDLERLYELSRAGLLARPDATAVDTAHELERALVAIFGFADARVELDEGAPPGPTEQVWPLRVGQTAMGRLCLTGPAPEAATAAALVGLVAIALERARLLRETSRVQALRESEALKTALLDAVAHDLRTPLTSIKAAATSLLASVGQADADARELLSIINEESDRLNHVVQNLLDLARIEGGALSLDPHPVALAPMLEAAITLARVPPERVVVLLPADLPPAHADGPLLSQATAQLLANAAAYSPPGSLIEIAASAADGELVIEIRDHGPGLAPEQLARIFDKFHREPRARALRPEGLGMGLAVARGILAAHRGRLEARSEPGRGACFWYTLPVAPAASASHGHPHPDR